MPKRKLREKSNDDISGSKSKKCKHPPTLIFTEEGLLSTNKIPYQILFMAQLREAYIDRLPIFCAIPCEIKETYQEGDVMSLRWNGVIKGKPGGCFPNGMIIDIWFNGSMYHTKLFSTGMLGVCNVKSYKEAEEIVKVVCNILRAAAKHISYLKENRDIIVPALKWLSDNSEGESFECLKTFESPKIPEYGVVRFVRRIKDFRISWPEEVPEEYSSTVLDFKLRNNDLTRDYITHTSFKERIKKVIEFCLEADEEDLDKAFTIKNIKYSSCVRRYNVGFHIDRYALNSLLEELGYNPYFANMCGSKLTVNISNDMPFDKRKVHRTDVSGDSIFTFNPRGTIGHNGCMESLMDHAFEKFLGQIYEHKDRIMAKRGPEVTIEKRNRFVNGTASIKLTCKEDRSEDDSQPSKVKMRGK